MSQTHTLQPVDEPARTEAVGAATNRLLAAMPDVAFQR
jgi:hypothetical protein